MSLKRSRKISGLVALAIFSMLHRAARADSTSADVIDRAIEKGIQALLDASIAEDEIRFKTRQRGGKVRTVRGHVEKDRGARIDFRTTDGEKISIRRVLIEEWKQAGLLKEEMAGFAYTGPTTLAAFALVAAGVDTQTPQLARMLGALERADTKEMGTYVVSLRASLWSLLLERKLGVSRHAEIRKLLQKDTNWLLRARTTEGAYTYLHPSQMDTPGDNSNTQFAHLGLWAAEVANAEVNPAVWLSMEQHWLSGQEPDGGWGYINGHGGSSSSMTVAGCNSLYIVLDRHYARADFPYRYFEGAKPNKKARKKMDRIYRAIEDGNAYLTTHRPEASSHHGYELFGLERLGLASGRTHIGGVEWFEHYAKQAIGHTWGENAIGDAFLLIFLVHGRAPVLFQKLAHGPDVHEWNYYHRDLSGLVRYLSGNFERIHRWQIIPETATAEQMMAAPFLYIAGYEPLELKSATREAIRRYIDGGGVVFLHANRSSNKFIESAESQLEAMFSERELKFADIPEDDPLYSCLFRGTRKSGWKKRVPFRALRDGPRILALLSPVDLAGAWHQDRREHEELYQIMANVRVYCAPPYAELPRGPVAPLAAGTAAPPRGELSILRAALGAPIHYGFWQRHADDIRRQTGLTLRIEEKGLPHDPGRLAGYDVVHVSLRGDKPVSPQALKALSAYAKGGGFVLIDAADGQTAASAAVLELSSAIDVGQRAVLAADQPLATGGFDGGKPLLDLETTRAGLSLRRGKAPPPIVLRSVDGGCVVAACPFDLVAGLDGYFIWERVGYTRNATRKIIHNILLWRWHEKNGRTAKKAP